MKKLSNNLINTIYHENYTIITFFGEESDAHDP
jgi:hypothetical protein